MTHPCRAGQGGRRGTGWTTQGETMACMVTFVSLAGVLSETFACMDAIVSLAGALSETSVCMCTIVSPPSRKAKTVGKRQRTGLGYCGTTGAKVKSVSSRSVSSSRQNAMYQGA